MRRRPFRLSFVFVLLVVSLAQAYRPSNAQGTPMPGKTWVVTAPSDQFTKLDGMCDSTCYLAEALGQAHDGDTITFLPELKGNFFLGPGDLTLNDLSIIGKGSSSADIFLQYRPQVVAKRVLLQNVTIESAAVFGTSSLELRDVTMRSRGGYLFVGEGSNLLATNLTYIDEIEVYSEPWAAFRIEGSADIYNSLFVSKTSGGAGLVLNRGISIIRNSTIVLADNTIKTSERSRISLQNSILLGDGIHQNCVNNKLQDLGGNVQFNTKGCPSTIPVGDPELGPLQFNGGKVPTMALLPGSAAIGRATDCPAEDQRGFKLPAGKTSGCDAGAYQTAAVEPSTATP